MYQGFTIVELIVVLVIIGLLASMALPKFGNLSGAAADASAAAVAGALGSAAADYNAKCKYAGGPCAALSCSQGTITALMTGITATDYTVNGSPSSGCTIRHTAHGTITYTSARIDQ